MKNKAKASGRSSATAVSRPIDNDWRRWIAENLLLGVPRETLADTMAASGFARSAALSEIDRALGSPYLDAARQLNNRLRKRDWMLAAYRKASRMRFEADGIPARNRLSHSEFFDRYYSANLPVVITGMMEDWPAMRKWNLDFFAREYGDREVEVQMGRNSGENYEIEREKYMGKMQFRELVEKVRGSGVTNDFYMTANNHSSNKAALAGLWNDIAPFPEYLDGNDKTAGFFWFGPAGTITPFHHDLTNNFMAQVMGRKRIKLAPSWDMPLMQNHFHVYSRLDGRAVQPDARPESIDSPQILELVLNPGEVLFIPVGWMHFVEGLDISVTMSFTHFLYDNDFTSFYSTYHEV